MTAVTVGQPAPPLHLPAASGKEIGLEDYRGKSNLIVWFTKGMACPFCRQQMSQLARGYERIKAREAEVLLVSITRPERARFYAQNFRIPFPYLCDPDHAVRQAWGLEQRAHSPLWYVGMALAASRLPKPVDDSGMQGMPLREMPQVMADEDMGFFVLDHDGVVRHAVSDVYMTKKGPRELPVADEIDRLLAACAAD